MTCQRANRKLVHTAPELHPVLVKSPWHHIGIDFVGPILELKSGNLYILTVSDYFSKWVEAVPLPSKHAVGVAHTLFKVSKNEMYSVAVVRVCWKHYSNK